MTIIKNASVDDGGSLQTNNALQVARGTVTLDGAGAATQALPGFSSLATFVLQAQDPSGNLSYVWVPPTLSVTSAGGAADAGNNVAWVAID